jgi:signal transduction histidine kinase
MPPTNVQLSIWWKTFRNFSGKGLSLRLTLATLLYSLLVAVFVSVIQIYLTYQDGVSNAREIFIEVESSYLPNLSASLWEVDSNRTQMLLDGLARLPNVSFVKLTDQAGQRWEKLAPIHKPLSSRTFTLTYHEGETRQEFQLGTLYMELSDRLVIKELKAQAISIAITSSATLLLGSVFVLILFQYWVTRHLEKMATFASNLDLARLNEKLMLDRRSNSVADELDLVANAINSMQTTIKDELATRKIVEDELRKHKEHLEDTVLQRTLALEEKSVQLEKQTQALESQNRELDAYAHSVAHDLKTPLTTLIGMSTLLNSGAIAFSPEQTRNSIAIIHRTAAKMNAIIDALLLLASVRRADNLSPAIIDLRKVAEEAQARLAELAERHGSRITFTGTWLPALGYEPWIEEVWVNYLSNAIKYGGTPARIEIGCELINESQIKCWVRDYGAGIEASKRADLFIQFSRLDPHVSDGHGLGLSIVKRIIQRLHGNVGYEDAPGGGSCFWFTLPAITQTLASKISQ